jgi:RNA polymerase sigma factor (sigma-70 family)
MPNREKTNRSRFGIASRLIMPPPPMQSDGPLSPGLEPGSITLLERARQGDAEAANTLIARYLPRMRRWARNRVPSWARNAEDTEDLVQDTVIGVLRHLNRIEYRQEGALPAYLRQALLNRIRLQFRRADRRPAGHALTESHPASDASPLEEAIGTQMVDRYESALLRLSQEDRELLVARIEMGYSNEELALLFDKPTKDAARMAAARALLNLATEMKRE